MTAFRAIALIFSLAAFRVEGPTPLQQTVQCLGALAPLSMNFASIPEVQGGGVTPRDTYLFPLPPRLYHFQKQPSGRWDISESIMPAASLDKGLELYSFFMQGTDQNYFVRMKVGAGAKEGETFVTAKVFSETDEVPFGNYPALERRPVNPRDSTRLASELQRHVLSELRGAPEFYRMLLARDKTAEEKGMMQEPPEPAVPLAATFVPQWRAAVAACGELTPEIGRMVSQMERKVRTLATEGTLARPGGETKPLPPKEQIPPPPKGNKFFNLPHEGQRIF